jgi:hypothetical protein
MSSKFENTKLWQRAFGEQSRTTHAKERDYLKVEYDKIRDNASVLVAKISNVLPGLTVHDITHLDALWETADVIAGNSFELNPLETFVFGCGVLLHDAAMCWEAYTDGRDGVRATTEWKDAYAIEKDRDADADDEDRKKNADFAAIRELHAHQAKNLPSLSWKNSDDGSLLFLINDPELRGQLADLVGSIAASHHWSIEEVETKLGQQFNPSSALPREWVVDKVKVACLLRCADAAHINSDRAPLFLYALARPAGVSALHWKAQNKLHGPALDQQAKNRICYSATSTFKEMDAAAWWVAKDAVDVVDREIKTANALLSKRGLSKFSVEGVTGAESADVLLKTIPTDGSWTPCEVKAHVSNVEHLIRELGGEKLYGAGNATLEIVLRELIQNARDAIVARRYANTDDDFEGRIDVKLEGKGNDLHLSVLDNGLGMSHRVMAGPLLDFGTSFWKSSLVQREWPGLRSSKFRSIGRFGIGFYSVFMIADDIVVTSRQFSDGLGECRTLKFTKATGIRPIVVDGKIDGYPTWAATKVQLVLQPGLLDSDQKRVVRAGYGGMDDFSVDFPALVSALVVGLDVKLSVWVNGQQTVVQDPGSVNTKKMLEKISYSRGTTGELSVLIARHHARVRAIRGMDGQCYGYAALSTFNGVETRLLSVRTVGGLATGTNTSRAREYFGYMDYEPASARRDPNKFSAPKDALTAWVNDQIRLLDAEELTDHQRSVAAQYAVDFSFDPIDFGRVLAVTESQGRFFTYEELANLAITMPVSILVSSWIGKNHASPTEQNQPIKGRALIYPCAASGQALNVELNEGVPAEKHSIIGCLHRAILNQGLTPVWQREASGRRDATFGPLDIVSVTATPIASS